MRYIQCSTLVLCFLVHLAAAIPSSSVTFSIQQVKRGEYFKNGAVERIKAHIKFGAAVPDNVLAVASRASGLHTPPIVDGRSVAASAEDYYGSVYLSPVTLGSDTLHLNLDTGSADLWAFSTLLRRGLSNGQAKYNPLISGTVHGNETWRITYGDGSGASGKVYGDTVVVGEVTATSQAVGAATSASALFVEDSNTDGVLGLAFSKINSIRPHPQPTFFDTIKGSLKSTLFTALLRKGAPGQYDFGYINSSLFTGPLNYAPIDTGRGFWTFNATGYAIGAGPSVSTVYKSIADTGTSLLYLPSEVVNAYYGNVSGASFSENDGGWIVPCRASLPSFSAVIGGFNITVPGPYLNYVPVNRQRCYGGMQEDTGIGFSIFGAIFLKSQFVVFDSTTNPPRIGFARQTDVIYS